jgi:ribonucleoside-diphosphate reductase alpha chain
MPEYIKGLSYDPFCIEWSDFLKRTLSEQRDTLAYVWDHAILYGEEYGYRNAQVSLLAPTGTIALAMDCATTSSEPFFSHIAYKKLVGGGLMEQVNPILEATLRNLGYSDGDIVTITQYIMRRSDAGFILDGNIENAPCLKEHHRAIFDTANKCGTGKRFIHHMGHVRMMAAIQPHLSGAMSKTVNLPADATLSDVSEVYTEGYRLGLKAIALFRDGCKASQPLTTDMHTGNKIENNYAHWKHADLVAELIKRDKVELVPAQTGIIRTRPEGILRANRHPAQLDDLKIYVIVSYYQDSNRMAEIFIEGGRQGSLVRGLLDDISTTISKMLQYGIPPEDIARMYRGQNYAPNGYVQRHPYIKACTSITDLVSKVIDIELGEYSRVQVKPATYDGGCGENGCGGDETADSVIIRGEVICKHCHSDVMIKNGTCYVCRQCGNTTGCS